jgi:HAD superfamily hydrolase (TIGR01509 family)
MPPRGVIFDLDGTLVDSGLDFDQMRRKMGIEGRRPVLESVLAAPAEEAERLWAIVVEHELRGVERATVFPGVAEFLTELGTRGIKRGVLTRNSRSSALAMLSRLGLEVDGVVAREDGPAKPDPGGIYRLCDEWNVRPSACVRVGDYRFDIEAGQRAGCRTVLFTGAGGDPGLDGVVADHVLASFVECDRFWDWLLACGD